MFYHDTLYTCTAFSKHTYSVSSPFETIEKTEKKVNASKGIGQYFPNTRYYELKCFLT